MAGVAVHIINTSSNTLPQYETKGAAGADIRANLSQALVLAPMERALVPTGLFIQIPDGYEVQIRPRSGLAIRQGITCLNSPGTVDSDYRGEIKVVLVNLSGEQQSIQHGDRIAQMVIQKVERAQFELVSQLTITERNNGGFGSTGKQ